MPVSFSGLGEKLLERNKQPGCNSRQYSIQNLYTSITKQATHQTLIRECLYNLQLIHHPKAEGMVYENKCLTMSTCQYL